MDNEMSGQAAVVIQVRELHGDLVVHRTGPAETPALVVTPTLTWASEVSDWHAVVDLPIDQVPPAEDPREFSRWLRDHEVARPPDNTRLTLLVEGTSPQAVVLTDLVIAVTARRPAGPAEGVELLSRRMLRQLLPRWFHADLSTGDRVSASPRLRSGEFPYLVHQSEPEQFVVNLKLGGQDVEWLAELHWTSGGRSGVLEISSQGRPFLSRPGDSRPRYEWDFRTRQWCQT
jgi:hypothetical protein